MVISRTISGCVRFHSSGGEPCMSPRLKNSVPHAPSAMSTEPFFHVLPRTSMMRAIVAFPRACEKDAIPLGSAGHGRVPARRSPSSAP